MLPDQSLESEKKIKESKISNILILLIIWLTLKISFFLCVPFPVFGCWEKNIQIIKEIKNIDFFDYLIICENMCFCLCCLSSLWKLREKYSKKSKWFDYFGFSQNLLLHLINPICPGPLGCDRFPGGGSKCPDSIEPTILMIFQILFLQGLRYVYKGLETKIWGP